LGSGGLVRRKRTYGSADVICLSWLKTINRNYEAVADAVPITDPYVPYVGTKKIPLIEYPYGSATVDAGASTDLAQILRDYYDWDWPRDL
jgi:hypothetical protein